MSLNVSRLLLDRFPGLGVKGTVVEDGTLEVDMAMSDVDRARGYVIDIRRNDACP